MTDKFEELSPCPDCEFNDDLLLVESSLLQGKISCTQCGNSVPFINHTGDPKKNQQAASAAWNKEVIMSIEQEREIHRFSQQCI